MSNFSDYLESGIIDHFFRGLTIPKPAVIAIALCSGIPVDSNTGANIPEVANAGGYVRYNAGPPNDNAFYKAGSVPQVANGATENTSGYTWPTCSSTWGWVSGIAILDNTTYGAGNVLYHGALSVAKLVTTNDTFSISSGSLDITNQ
jgi:hypothetical protein